MAPFLDAHPFCASNATCAQTHSQTKRSMRCRNYRRAMRASTISAAIVLLATTLMTSYVAAHDDYLPLKQPIVIESPCVKRWNDMAAHFQNPTASSRDSTTIVPHNVRARPLAFENEPSELEVNLTVRMDRFESRYVGFNTRTYNGNVPAPTIKLCPGDRLTLRLSNELGDGDANMTNVHLHGLHVSPNGHADNVLKSIAPGDERVYTYDIRADHPAGTFWYHPHSHGIVNTQLSGLMAGALVVVDRPGDFPAELAAMDDLVLILQAICVENCHTTFDCIVNALNNNYDTNSTAATHMDGMSGMQGMDGMDDTDSESDSDSESDDIAPFPVDLRVDRQSPLNDTSLLHAYVNGQYLPEIHLARGAFKRLRFVNAIANNVAELVAPGCELHVLAMDGIYWAAPTQRSVVVLPPGGRADIAVKCMRTGTFFLATESSPSRNHLLGRVNQHRVPTQNVVSLRVLDNVDAAATTTALPLALPALPHYMRSNATAATPVVPPRSRYHYEFSVWMDNNAAMVYGVNKKPFEHTFVNHSMRVDELQEWELSVHNYGGHACDETPVAELVHQRSSIDFASTKHLLQTPSIVDDHAKHACHTMNHPFHMHSSHFQVTRRLAAADSDDTLFAVGEWRDTIPLFKTPVQIRFTPRDHMVGRVLTHCHVASHADGGMGQMVRVLPAEDNSDDDAQHR